MSATIQQKAIYTETQAGKLQITSLVIFFFPSSLARAALALRFISEKTEVHQQDVELLSERKSPNHNILGSSAFGGVISPIALALLGVRV